MGGYFGALLRRGGLDVHFLLNSDYDFVKANGLSVKSPNGDFHLPDVKAYRNAAEMPECDVTLITLKTTANGILKDVLPHTVKADGFAVTLQNGIGTEEEMAELIGAERVAGGVCFIGSTKIAPGVIRHSDYGQITLGDFRADGKPSGVTPRIERLGGVMKSVGIDIVFSDDLPLARWKKLCWNIPFNGTSVVKNALTDELVRNPELRALCRTLMQEVADASAACARPIEPEFLDKMMAYTELMTPYAPSMRVDFDRGRKMEIESIYGNPVRAAKAAGAAMPETEKLYHQLKALEEHYAG